MRRLQGQTRSDLLRSRLLPWQGGLETEGT